RAHREARQDHRDADAVARLVARVPVLGAVVFEETGPSWVQPDRHGRILVEVDGVGETPVEARVAPVGAWRSAPGSGHGRVVACFEVWSRILASTRGFQLALARPDLLCLSRATARLPAGNANALEGRRPCGEARATGYSFATLRSPRCPRRPAARAL